MTDHSVSTFLATTPFAGWTRTPLAGDASSRRYTRLQDGNQTAILMEAGPEARAETDTFVHIAAWLTSQALCAPRILAADTHQGLAILEDLGARDLATAATAEPLATADLYTAATDILIRLDPLTPPPGLATMTPTVAGDMLDVTCVWYAGTDPDPALAAAMAEGIAAHCSPPTHVALRDYHAENLIWRPDRAGTDKIGLLDFQDAFLAPRGYDLVSLTRDARRDVDPEVAASATVHFANGVGQRPADLSAALACLAVQRNLRILGVFARLAKRDGKQRYLTMLPRLWRMITEDLTHPALSDLRDAVLSRLPPPERSAIKDVT